MQSLRHIGPRVKLMSSAVEVRHDLRGETTDRKLRQYPLEVLPMWHVELREESRPDRTSSILG
jgi:hypothetical protein